MPVAAHREAAARSQEVLVRCVLQCEQRPHSQEVIDMTDEQNTILNGTQRLRACEVLLRDSIYKSAGMKFVHDIVKAELGRLEVKVASFLPADYECDA